MEGNLSELSDNSALINENQSEDTNSNNLSNDPDPETGTASRMSESEEQAVKPTSEIEETKEGTAAENVENEPPPEIFYTLESVSPDVDHFLSSLYSEKHGTLSMEATEEKENDQENEQGKEAKTLSLEIPVFVEEFMELVKEKLGKYESNEGKNRKWGQVPDDDSAFLEALDRVSKLTSSLAQFRSDPNNAAFINGIGDTQHRAMSYLEEEFRLLLEDAKCNDLESNSNNQKQNSEVDRGQLQESEDQVQEEDNLPGYSQEVVSNLNRIAEVMIGGGYESECCQVYMITRRHAFDECLNRIGFEKISLDEVQKMQWEALEREIPPWIKAFKDCAAIYFSRERKLADAIFREFPSVSANLFCNLTRGVVIELLNFAEGVAMTKRSAEKLFKFLDMYEALRDSVPAMDGLFIEECENELKTETFGVRCRIGEAAICLFCDLENSIKSDTGKTPVPGGAVHPLTRYTMNYLLCACEYKATLEQVFKEHSKIERADSTSRPRYEGGEAQGYNNNNINKKKNNNNNNDDHENQSRFANQLTQVMDLLDSNLEGKSKLYRDIALSCIFMMNNGRYILKKIKGSAEIHQAMGDSWCRKKSSDLRNYHKSYQRETWSKILSCFEQEGLQVNGKVVKPVLKERFKSFSMTFDEIHKTQSCWVVQDEQLQSELRVSITAVVVPAYRSFLGRFSQYLSPGRQYEKYIKFQPEDLETYIDELFDGTASYANRRRP